MCTDSWPCDVADVNVPTHTQRAYVVLAAAVLSLAWGHATADAIALGFVDPAMQGDAQAVSIGVAGANVLSAVLSLRLAMEREVHGATC